MEINLDLSLSFASDKKYFQYLKQDNIFGSWYFLEQTGHSSDEASCDERPRDNIELNEHEFKLFRDMHLDSVVVLHASLES